MAVRATAVPQHAAAAARDPVTGCAQHLFGGLGEPFTAAARPAVQAVEGAACGVGSAYNESTQVQEDWVM